MAAELHGLHVRTFPTQTYFFLADFAPRDAGQLARQLKQHGILIKPLDEAHLGPGFMRVTTGLPKDNQRVLEVLRELLA